MITRQMRSCPVGKRTFGESDGGNATISSSSFRHLGRVDECDHWRLFRWWQYWQAKASTAIVAPFEAAGNNLAGRETWQVRHFEMGETCRGLKLFLPKLGY